MLIGEVPMGASPWTGLSRATRRDTKAFNCEQPRITVAEFVMNRRVGPCMSDGPTHWSALSAELLCLAILTASTGQGMVTNGN